MKRLVKFRLEGGGSVVVEVDDPTLPGEQRVTRGTAIQEAAESFEAALEKMRPVAEAVLAKLQNLSTQPHEIGVEFGIKLGGKVDVWVAAAESEATFKVALKWKQEQ